MEPVCLSSLIMVHLSLEKWPCVADCWCMGINIHYYFLQRSSYWGDRMRFFWRDGKIILKAKSFMKFCQKKRIDWEQGKEKKKEKMFFPCLGFCLWVLFAFQRILTRKEEALDDLPWKEDRGPSSIRRTLEPFQRRHWGNFWETGWSAYGLFRLHRYHLELLTESNTTDIFLEPQRYEMQTNKRFKRTLFITTKYSMRIFGVIPFIELQNYI